VPVSGEETEESKAGVNKWQSTEVCLPAIYAGGELGVTFFHYTATLK